MMKSGMLGVFVLIFLSSGVLCDVYLHNPRGSNNRLNENTAERNNANRVFDSQNNNRGGYNVGDSEDRASQNNEDKQYRMKYFQSSAQYKTSEDGQSEFIFEWTNQHGCGGNEDTDPHKQNCNLVFQYMCTEDDPNSATGDAAENLLRNGVNTNTQNYNDPNNLNENENQANARERNSVQTDRVLQENYDWYDSCYVRERNNGLFTADQYLQNNDLGYSSAIYTRQNPNGNRNGYECPEERDYYPYWHPSPWKDIAVLAENASMCEYYQQRSFNVQPYHECLEYFPSGNRKPYSRWNNEAECTDNGGTWTLLYNYLEKRNLNQGNCLSQTANGIRHMWEVPHDTVKGDKECLVALDAPDCYEAPWSRSNHLGNGREPEANTYKWILPHFPSGNTMRCVSRLRYNISTDDYDPYNTDSSNNQDKATGTMSPVQQNPYVEINAGSSPLRLAINTAQFGRTFQDRSHVFKMMPRPSNVQNERIHNLNVRGKRGNIVQVYPAVEYDFVPSDLKMTQDKDLVHLQWTGSNTHNNKPPGGDGQTGDAGEGTTGTDRSNMVQIDELNENYPLPFEMNTMWKDAEIKWTYSSDVKTSEDLAINVASSGYFKCMSGCNDRPNQKANMQNQLNNAPASYEGVMLKMKTGTYSYIGSRNNNFSNRSQKGKITVL